REQRDVLAVGDHHVLYRRGDQCRRRRGLSDVVSAVQRQEAGGGGVPGREARHRNRQESGIDARRYVTDHGPVPRLAYLEHYVCLTAHMNAFLAYGERPWPVWGHIRALSDRRLDEDILGISVSGGESPGDIGVAT